MTDREEVGAFYDALAGDYDQMVDWAERLQVEGEWLRQQLAGAQRVLDAGCGSGGHALAFARWGHQVVGADLSRGMIGRAREAAQTAGLDIMFIEAGFGEIARQTGGDFDAVTCLGNSLPHLLSREALAAALRDFAALLRPGGILILQNRNYDKAWRERQRWLALNSYQERRQSRQSARRQTGKIAMQQDNRPAGRELLFFRMVDFHDGSQMLTFHVITFTKEAGTWHYRVISTPQRPIFHDELVGLLTEAGFAGITSFGDARGGRWDAERATDLVIVAHRGSA